MIDYNEREKKLFARVKEDYDYLTELGYEVLGVFVQGSDNYQLSYEGSDIDTKAILIPKFDDFAREKKPVSTTLIKDDNSHLDIKDIRKMHDCFLKQNINFLEILFTKYRWLNPEYANIYRTMFNNAEKIAHYNNYAGVNCIAGMVFEKRKALTHPYEGLKEKIEAHGYDNKQLHHILRCTEFLQRYIDGVPYSECLIPTDHKHLIDVKANYIYSLEEAIEIADKCVDIVRTTKKQYMDTHPVVVDKEVETIMDDVLLTVLKHCFKREISE